MKKIIIVIVSLVFLASCSENLGDRVDTKNLKVYYLDSVPKDLAIKFTEFWRDNGFIGDSPQYIQLDKEKDLYIVRLIEKEKYHDSPLTISQQTKLNDLERKLSKQVFKKRTIIEITDNTFREI